IGEQLEGDVAPELGIPRAIHLTHPARAEEGDDLVRAESNAWSEGHSERMMILRISECGLRICRRISDAVAVADGFDVPAGRLRRRRGRRARAIDDAAQIAVADGLAVLAERDHGAVDQV